LTARSVRTAFLNDAAQSQIGLLCHNDPVDNVDPMGLEENLAQKPISAWDPTGRAWLKQLRDSVQEVLRQIARQQVYAEAYGWSGHGAIGIGMANQAISQLSGAISRVQATLAAWTPIRNPHSKSYARVQWGGEIAPVYESPSQINAKYPGSKAYTVPNLNDPTGQIDPATGKIEINQVITATRHLPYGAGPGTPLYEVETRRVNFFRGVTGDANAAAQALAFKGFSDIHSGIQAVRDSTRQVFKAAALEYQTKVDAFGDFRP